MDLVQQDWNGIWFNSIYLNKKNLGEVGIKTIHLPKNKKEKRDKISLYHFILFYIYSLWGFLVIWTFDPIP